MFFPFCFASALVPQTRPDVVVMIHGAGGGGWEYDRWKPVFTHAGWRVVAQDLQPARSGLARTEFNDYLRQVKASVPRRHGRLVIVGASLGGILALKAAETLRPDAIVLVNGVPPRAIPFRQRFKPHPSVVRWANGPVKDTRDAMPDSDEATILWASKRWRDESGQVLDQVEHGIPARRPTMPALVVLSGKDTDVPPKVTEQVAMWASAKLVRLPNASHVGPLLGRSAPAVAQQVLTWINRTLDSRRA